MLTPKERSDLSLSTGGATKLSFLDSLSDSDLEKLLGSDLRDSDGNPASPQEKIDYRTKILNRWKMRTSVNEVRAEANITKVQGDRVDFSAFEDYSAYETSLIRAKAKKCLSYNSSLSVPKDVIKALDTQEIENAITAAIPGITVAKRRDLVIAMAQY